MNNRSIKKAGLITAAAMLIFYSCNHGRPCINLKLFSRFFTMDLIGEPYGATDINALFGNQGLTVAENQEGTVTVFKWPNPSFYDQIAYMTTDREKPRLGALANEGVFSGIYFETDSEKGFFWLRDLPHKQAYLAPDSAAVKTAFVHKDLGLEIGQTDLVEPGTDVFWRNYSIQKLPGSRVKLARVFAYAHFAPKVSKLERLPLSDWCLDPIGNSRLEWDRGQDLFIQSKSGKDLSTHKPGAIALAFGFEQNSFSHQAGHDSACPINPAKDDPFLLAGQKSPSSDSAQGKVASAISAELAFDNKGTASASFLIAAAADQPQTINLIKAARAKGFKKALTETDAHWKDLLKKAPLPNTDNARIREMALRSVMILLLGYCRDTGAMVASVSTQPPYGEDWPRDGSYLNQALLAAGFPDLVKRHNLFYAKMQSQPGHKISMVPQGNWASNYLADGTPGFPVLYWELDETGFALWTLYRYYEFSHDRAYLEQVYPAIKRAADFLVQFRDPATGLTRPAYESDETQKSASLRGALSAYLGLKYAIKAGSVMADEASQKEWTAREEELEKLILAKYYDPACRRFVRFEKFRGNCAQGAAGWEHLELLWPAELVDLSDPRAEELAVRIWSDIEPSFAGKREAGLYELYYLLALARLWKDRPEKMDMVKAGLLWEATVPATDTGLLGEIWLKQDGQVIAGQSQPQLWQHALFYLAALQAYGSE